MFATGIIIMFSPININKRPIPLKIQVLFELSFLYSVSMSFKFLVPLDTIVKLPYLLFILSSLLPDCLAIIESFTPDGIKEYASFWSPIAGLS